MSYIRSNLPAELVLDISNNIKNWQDRYQFALTSRHHWYCIIRNSSLREVQLKDEKNLLKIRIARSIILSPGLQVERDISKAVRFLAVCAKLKAVVITNIRAASQRGGSIEIIVPAPIYAKWASVLDNQKFKQDKVTVSCELDDENPVSSNSLCSDTDFLASINYSKCSHIQQSVEYISNNADSVASSTGSYFVGAVICFEKVKILVTSLDVFFHIEYVDDCAYSNQWLNESVFAKLHMKSEKGNNFFELSIIVDGCIELLAVGGLVLINGGSVEPFLGSSVKPVNRAKVIDGDVQTSNIFVNANKEVVATERYLRQYYKADASRRWSFHQKSSYDAGFYPIHPLHVDQYISISPLPLILQSNLLLMYATKQVNHDLLSSLLRAVVGSSMLRKECKLVRFTGSSFNDLYNTMTINGKWKIVIGIAKDLEAGSVNFQDDKSNVSKNKKTVLQIVNGGYLSSLSKFNDKNCAVFKMNISQ
ncbi:hypothetical protein MBANPS3_003296 [Mucor bainieri]